ncbi:MAG: twin-arginine translocase subunit TatC [Gammaproteobacteria bacterium]|nr:twin-arginine translocase subunit TatC [Gammaproteobacteria bacterium]MCW8888935.1 twin-arginine translocase subunit TatC [Gammaproteobacteria bacterium]MCW8983276.1 twin-arginine translocase subunit TatC [Gammaproteobacteria bacterium]
MSTDTEQKSESTDSVEVEQPFISHLIEMRDRLLRVVVVVIVVFIGLFSFANELYNLVATPLMVHLPEGASMIATKPAGTFFTPMKLALVFSIFASMPFILYQMWSFVAPGLYSHEKRMAIPLMVSSTLLFYLGMAFAYYVVFPLMFGFFVAMTPEGVTVMTDIGEYLDFILKIFFAFGVAFEVPIAVILLIWGGVTTAEDLAQKRPYMIVGAFVIGMLLTPPDIISQTLLALPMWLLFEAGLFASHYFVGLSKEARENERAMEEEFDRAEAEERSLDDEGP